MPLQYEKTVTASVNFRDTKENPFNAFAWIVGADATDDIIYIVSLQDPDNGAMFVIDRYSLEDGSSAGASVQSSVLFGQAGDICLVGTGFAIIFNAGRELGISYYSANGVLGETVALLNPRFSKWPSTIGQHQFGLDRPPGVSNFYAFFFTGDGPTQWIGATVRPDGQTVGFTNILNALNLHTDKPLAEDDTQLFVKGLTVLRGKVYLLYQTDETGNPAFIPEFDSTFGSLGTGFDFSGIPADKVSDQIVNIASSKGQLILVGYRKVVNAQFLDFHFFGEELPDIEDNVHPQLSANLRTLERFHVVRGSSDSFVFVATDILCQRETAVDLIDFSDSDNVVEQLQTVEFIPQMTQPDIEVGDVIFKVDLDADPDAEIVWPLERWSVVGFSNVGGLYRQVIFAQRSL